MLELVFAPAAAKFGGKSTEEFGKWSCVEFAYWNKRV
jgi:hypothetical protein